MFLVVRGEQAYAPEPLPGFRGFTVMLVDREVFERLGDDCSIEKLVAATQFPGTPGALVTVPSDRVILDDLLSAAMTPEGNKTLLFG